MKPLYHNGHGFKRFIEISDARAILSPSGHLYTADKKKLKKCRTRQIGVRCMIKTFHCMTSNSEHYTVVIFFSRPSTRVLRSSYYNVFVILLRSCWLHTPYKCRRRPDPYRESWKWRYRTNPNSFVKARRADSRISVSTYMYILLSITCIL